MLTAYTTVHAISVAALALVGGTAIGYPAACIVEKDAWARLLIAPVIGLGLFGVVGTLFFRLVPFAPAGIVALALATALVPALIARRAVPMFASVARVPAVWALAALALALAPALAIAPQWHGGTVLLGSAVFDHGKAALVDEIVRNGVPVHNPFFQAAGSANLLNYYYLYYLVAAAAARLVGATGWEADVAMTGVAGFCALAVLAWAAVLVSGRRVAAWWVLPIAFAGSFRVIINLVFGMDLLHGLLANEHHFEGWLEQTTWTPQHTFAATLALLAVLGVAGLLRAGRVVPAASLLCGALIAASYDSSLWIGGIGLAVILPVLGTIGLVAAKPGARLAAAANLATAALTALALAADFIWRNLSLAGHRQAVALWSYPTIAAQLHAPLILNEIAYWLVWIVLDLGFAYVLSIVCLAAWARRRPLTFDPLAVALALAIALPLLVAQHVHSIIANNDLGWRIMLLAAFAMTAVAAALASRMQADGRRTWLLLAVAVLLMPGVIAGIVSATVSATYGLGHGPNAFLERQDLWRAVRAVTPKDEAVLNNPDDLAAMTLYPGNLGWALLADRRSCAAGREWLAAMAPQLLPDAQARLNERIARVFDGKGSEDDFRRLAQDHLCRTLVVVPVDGLWSADATNLTSAYVLADARDGQWRIYRSRQATPN